MPIPEFNQRGVLPTGLHQCTTEEFIKKFCYKTKYLDPWVTGNIRDSYAVVLEQLFGHFLERGSKSLIFGGSFITKEEHPNDVDCIVILPNEKCIPHKNEFFILCDCKLDLVYALETDKSFVSRMINMFSKDRFDLDIGLVEVILDDTFKSSWQDFYGDGDVKELMQERESYIKRHLLVGSEKKGLLVTIHGLNTHAEWNFALAPIASANNWIFAPYNYGNVKTPLVSNNSFKDIIENFREWIKIISDKYKYTPSIFAHSFGSYIIAKYINEFDYAPPIKLKNIILAGSILNENFDWIKGFEKKCYNSVFNIISPNDPWVPLMSKVPLFKNNKLYGTAGSKGFSQEHPRLFSEKINLYDHSNMLKIDVFENKILPFLNMSENFKFDNFIYLSALLSHKITNEFK